MPDKSEQPMPKRSEESEPRPMPYNPSGEPTSFDDETIAHFEQAVDYAVRQQWVDYAVRRQVVSAREAYPYWPMYPPEDATEAEVASWRDFHAHFVLRTARYLHDNGYAGPYKQLDPEHGDDKVFDKTAYLDGDFADEFQTTCLLYDFQRQTAANNLW